MKHFKVRQRVEPVNHWALVNEERKVESIYHLDTRVLMRLRG